MMIIQRQQILFQLQMLLFLNTLLHYQHMDIPTQAYVVCCVLPLIASIALSIQIYLHSSKPLQKPASFQLPNDDFLYSMQGLITIIQQNNRIQYPHYEPNTHNQPQKPASCQTQTEQKMKCVSKPKRQCFSSNKSLLQGCNAGLAKMKLINDAFLNNKKGYFSSICRQQKTKRIKRSNKEDFEPTYLPIIVEGLQY